MKQLAKLGDDDLMRLTAQGNEDAFTVLYRRRQSAIFRFALQMSGSGTIAEDVTQEVFMTVIRQAATYDPARGPAVSWLYGIARNHIRRCVECEQTQVSTMHEAAGYAPAAERDLLRDEEIRELRQAVLALPTSYREIVVLCELHEMSYEQASAVLGCAVGTVRSRLHRARALLARKLQQSGKARCAP